MPHYRYRFGATDVEVHARPAPLAAAVGAVFAHLGVPPAAPDRPAPARVALDLEVAEEGLDVPAGAREAAPLSAFVRAWEAGGCVYLSADWEGTRSVVCVDAGAGRARGRVHPALVADPREAWWRLFVFVVSSAFLLLRRRGLYALHAAALGRPGTRPGPAEPAGAGLLLVGDSDAGKSTLACALVRAGWPYLSDDTVLLDGGGAAVGAVPFRRHFGLDTVAGRFFPELAGGPHLPLAEEDKWVVDVERQFPGRTAGRIVPRVVVVPQIVDADESRVEPASAVDAHYALVRQSALVRLEPDAAREHLAALARLVGQTRHYRLFGGRDVVRRPARASELLAPLLTDA